MRLSSVLVGSAAGSFLLLDTLRVWTPSLTTIFGSAGSTSAYSLILFSLAWILPAVLVVPVAARWSWAVPIACAAVAVLARLVLQAGATGNLQLYAASVATLALSGWLVSIGVRGWPAATVATGVAIGLAVTTVLQLVTRGVDVTWQPAALGWPVLLLAAGGTLWGTIASGDVVAAGPRWFWFAIGPALALAGIVTTALGRTWASTQWPPPWWGGVLVTAAALGGVWFAAHGGLVRWPWLAAVLVLAATALADLPRAEGTYPSWAAVPQAVLALVVPAALAHAARAQDHTAVGRGLLAYSGLVAFLVLVSLYYVTFDELVPIPRPVILLVIAALVALPSLAGRSAPDVAVPWAPVAVGVVLVLGAGFLTAPKQPQRAADPALPLTIMTYNVRYGISDGGRFDPDTIAAVIESQRPDVVQLQEIERGWLLNGGHDVLSALQKRLGMFAYYNPASDPLFGDAILTRTPLTDVRSVPFPAYDTPTRAGVLNGTLTLADGTELVLAVSHLHEAADGVDVRQVTDLAARMRELTASGTPVVLTGDYNLEPDDPRLRPLLDVLRDGLAPVRPLPTSPAGAPAQQIDYILVSDGLAVSEQAAPRTTASDHLPVVAKVTRP